MRNSFSHTFSLFIRNTLLTKKAGAVLLIFLAAYTLGTGIGFFLDHTPFHKNAEAVETSAEGNWGLSFQEEGQPPVANATFEELAQYDAFYAQDTNKKILYLTFDCGYENGNTPQILDALKKHGAPATFFVVGTYIESNPELIKRMISEGHTVGNHTWHHPDMAQISAMEIFQKELTDVEDAYKEVTGEEMTKFYRPPPGKIQRIKPKERSTIGLPDLFLEPGLCRLVRK